MTKLKCNVIQWNCRGLRGNREQIEILIDKYNPAAICLQETRLRHDTSQTFKYYSTYYSSTDTGDGGVGILVKNTCIHSNLPLRTNLQAVAVCVTLNNKSYTICSIYIPPSQIVTAEELHNLVNQFHGPYIINGDFNAHSPLWGTTSQNNSVAWGTVSQNNLGNVVEQFLNDHDLVLLNTDLPTRFDEFHKTYSLLDLTICHPSVYLDFRCNIFSDRFGSDHFPIQLLSNSDDFPEPETISRWNFKKAKWDEFQERCIEQITEEVLEEETDKMSLFTQLLLDIAADTIPKTVPSPKKRTKPWFDEDCKNAAKNRKQAAKVSQNCPDVNNIMRSRLIQAQTKKLFKSKKRESWRRYVSSITNKTHINKVWKMVNKIAGKNSSNHLHHLKDGDGNLITDKESIANALGKSFEKSSSSSNYSSEFQKLKKTQEMKKINFRTNVLRKYNKRFKLRDLKRSFKKANNSAPGPDQIHYEILRHLPLDTLKVLLNIINEVWTDGNFPQSWREALIIPIPKPGKDHYVPINYRPIALTSCICKSVERMVNERLIWYLEKTGKINKFQCGFRANRSTVDHLVRLETFIRDAFTNGEHLVAVFFDLQKAYDTTWKHGIMNDLYDMGLRGNLPIFISNFLSDRTFQVLVGATISDQFDQEEGVPQGAILSTTLFNVKINNIIKVIQPGVECSLYVDDFVIIYRSKSINDIERKLQLAINGLNRWTFENGFTISKNKTVAMHFCRKRQHDDPVLKLGNSQIQFVKEFKFLGLIWDCKLSFKPHITYLRQKCHKTLNLLKVLSNTEWGADKDTLLKLYRSLVRSKLDYGSIVYGSACKTHLEKLDTVHNQGLRLCLGAFRSSPVESLYVEAHEPPLELRRQKLAMQYRVKLSANPTNPAYDVVFKSMYKESYLEKSDKNYPFSIRSAQMLRGAKINTSNVLENSIPDNPIWDSFSPSVVLNLSVYDKSSTPPEIFQSEFNELKAYYSDYCHIYTDGSKQQEKVASAVVTPYGTSSFRLPDNSSIFSAETESYFSRTALCKVFNA